MAGATNSKTRSGNVTVLQQNTFAKRWMIGCAGNLPSLDARYRSTVH
jgi:hypothetical protein